MEEKSTVKLNTLRHNNNEQGSFVMYPGHRVVEEETDDGFDESDNNRTLKQCKEESGKKKDTFLISNGKTSIKKYDDSETCKEVSKDADEGEIEQIVTNGKMYLSLNTKKKTSNESFEETTLSSDASNKRIAWRNSTTLASERDSVLTASGDERSSSCEMRLGDKSAQDFGVNKRPESSFEKENNNRLAVPSPGRKTGFYSTTPSTDEGIVTDDQVVLEDPKSPAKTLAVKLHTSKTTPSHIEENISSEKINSSFNSPIGKEDKSPYISYMCSKSPNNYTKDNLVQRQQTYSSSAYLESAGKETSDPDGDHDQPNDLLVDNASRRFCCNRPRGRNERCYIEVSTAKTSCFRLKDDSGRKRRQLYQDRSSDNSTTFNHFHKAHYDNKSIGMNSRDVRIEKQLWRQASEHMPKYSLQDTHSSAHTAWNSVSSCCEFGRNDGNPEDYPVLLYSRSPTEVRSCESKLPILFERRESEVVFHNGTNLSRILPHRNETSNFTKSPELKQVDCRVSPSVTPATITQSNLKQNAEKTSPPLEIKLKPANTDSDPQEESISREKHSIEKFFPCDSFSLKSNSSFSTKNSWKDSCSNTVKTKTPSRTGSARSSAVAEALSSVVVASATGSVMPAGSHLTSTEKQKSLTERLMTVGPSDPRRVQGIVEDILCEMGEERIIQYKDAFARFDKDSSGIISSKQLRSLLRSLGHNPTDVELRELVNQVDMDENGKIDFNEFIIMIGYFDKANNENEDLINIFRVFDRHEKGCIDVDELRNIWNNFLHEITPEDTFEEMLSVVDSDGNGEINRVELLELLSTR